MENISTHLRWQQVFSLLSKLKSGNFAAQIPSSKRNDKLEKLVVLLNMFAQKLEAIFKENAYERPRNSFLFKSKMAFMLNTDFEIINATQEAITGLEVNSKDVLRKDFKSLLTDASRQHWELLEKELEPSKINYFNFRLCFTTTTGLYIQADCSITKWLFNNHASYSISSDEISILTEDPNVLLPKLWKEIERKQKKPTRTAYPKPTRPSEVKKIRELRKYIEKNAETRVLDYKTQANEYGTNERKLKDGFKHIYKETPSQFHYKKLLRKIRNQIVNSQKRISTISDDFGFDTAYFSKLVKKKFGVSPRDLRKREKEDD